MQRPDLQPQIEALPKRPGVYQFLDAEGAVLYVGKAVSLRSRVRSYFYDSAVGDPKTRRILEHLASGGNTRLPYRYTVGHSLQSLLHSQASPLRSERLHRAGLGTC